MRHRKLSKTLSRPTAPRKALIRNLVRELLIHERISTTLAKARVTRSFAERIITLGRRKDLSSQRKAFDFLGDKSLVKRLFKDIGPRFQNRQGGYTRVIKLGNRSGDQASMALIELVDRVVKEPVVDKPAKETKGKKEEALSK